MAYSGTGIGLHRLIHVPGRPLYPCPVPQKPERRPRRTPVPPTRLPSEGVRSVGRTRRRPLLAARLTVCLVLAAVMALMPARPAAAHGELVGASPGPGETVGRVAHVDLVFSTPMFDWQLSVDGPSGAALGGVAVQKADQLLSFETPSLTEEGQYIVRYSGIDSDGDVVEGAYAFVFEEGAPPPADLPLDLSVLDDDGWPWWLYGLLLLGVVVIAVLAGLLAEKTRRLRIATDA